MLNIKKLLLAISVLIALPVFAALGPGPIAGNSTTAGGPLTAAGTACQVGVIGVDGYVVVLDGSALATSTITVNINVLDPVTGTYSTPVSIGGVTNPITFTNGTTQVLTIPGGYAGIQVAVTSFGTATGTFNAWIATY